MGLSVIPGLCPSQAPRHRTTEAAPRYPCASGAARREWPGRHQCGALGWPRRQESAKLRPRTNTLPSPQTKGATCVHVHVAGCRILPRTEPSYPVGCIGSLYLLEESEWARCYYTPPIALTSSPLQSTDAGLCTLARVDSFVFSAVGAQVARGQCAPSSLFSVSSPSRRCP